MLLLSLFLQNRDCFSLVGIWGLLFCTAVGVPGTYRINWFIKTVLKGPLAIESRFEKIEAMRM